MDLVRKSGLACDQCILSIGFDINLSRLPYPRLYCSETDVKTYGFQEKTLKIQFNTDVNIHGTEELATKVSASVEHALEYFKEHITRVEVHLSDESRGKSGQHDHRCMLEARLEGRKPVAVTEHARTLDLAVNGAAEKLAHLLSSALGRVQKRRDKSSVPPLPDEEPDQG